MTYPCPYCNAPASAATGCPACGRAPDPDALEVIRLDSVIAALTAQLHTARLATQRIEGELTQAWARRNVAAAKVRTVVAHSAAVRDVPLPTATHPVGDLARAQHPVPPSRETSTKWIQNALFLLGGLLLAVAAIVFTAVAWAQFGVGGRAALLAAFTGAALAVPPLAQRRSLTATAETFAAVGLLLIVLDGYAAWYVNLFGLATWSPWSYAAAVCAVTAAVAAAYARVTGLTGPRFAALLIAQPVLPLFLLPDHPHTTAAAYIYAGVALLDLAVLFPTSHALRLAAGALGALAVVIVTAFATTALTGATNPARAALAGGALILAALLTLTAAIRLRHQAAQAATAGALVLSVAAPAARIAVLLAPANPLLPACLALLAVAVLAATARFVWLGRTVVAQGVQIGAATALLPAAVIAFAAAAGAAVRTLETARPVLHAVLAATVPGADLRLPLTIAVLTPAIAVTVPAEWRRWTVQSAAALALLTLPAALALPWWTAPIFDLAGAAAALFLIARRPRDLGPLVITALLLTAHGMAAGFGTAAVAAGTLAAVSALGLALTRRAPLAGPGLFVGLLTWPAVAWATATALTPSAAIQSRAALIAALLPAVALHVLGRRRLGDRRPFALAAALIPAAIAPLWGYAAGDPAAVYAAVALLALATLAADPETWFAAILPAATLLTATALPLAGLLFPPAHVPATAPAAFLIATAAVALATVIRGHRRLLVDASAPILAVTTALALAAAHAPWPLLPAAELLLGLAGLLWTALRPGTSAFTPYGIVIFTLLAGAGVTGALTTRPATIAALGAVLIAGAMAGVAGRSLPARLSGWLAAVAAAYGIAVTPAVTPTFLILTVAAATLALAWLLRDRLAESRLVEAAAHAGAVLALLSASHLRTTAAICVLWGVALGLRALRRDGRDAFLIAAATAELAGWLQLMVVAHIGTLEAYSIPVAAVALLAGLRIRRRAELSSWVAYGPALAAALIPSLGSILVTDGQHLRRLLLGVAALAVLLAGARARLQAPVVLGGAALALVALHELALVWDLVPRWIPLATAGLLLVLLATTLERRRRDFDRIRTALTRMT